ncbi:hypothetical protein D9M71_489240 [compost metagenome]
MTGNDFGNLHQPLLEGPGHFLGVRVHHDADKSSHAKAQRLGGKDGLVAGDVAVLFQQLDPSPARRGGQRDVVGQLGNGQSRVVLQGSQQGAVGTVDGGRHDLPSVA